VRWAGGPTARIVRQESNVDRVSPGGRGPDGVLGEGHGRADGTVLTENGAVSVAAVDGQRDPVGERLIGHVAGAQGLTLEAFAGQLMGSLGASTGRIATPTRSRDLVAFLASPNNITGSEHLVDGGIVKSA
jgi:hypothetical protein